MKATFLPGSPATGAAVVPTASPARPEFVRLPKPGTLCPWTGLSRSKINELILPSSLNGHRPLVRSISLRNRGQIRAVRLINFDSLMGYLRSLEDSSEDGGTQEATAEEPPFPMAQGPLETRSKCQMADHLPRTGERQYR
jgi:hypothetical protein